MGGGHFIPKDIGTGHSNYDEKNEYLKILNWTTLRRKEEVAWELVALHFFFTDKEHCSFRFPFEWILYPYLRTIGLMRSPLGENKTNKQMKTHPWCFFWQKNTKFRILGRWKVEISTIKFSELSNPMVWFYYDSLTFTFSHARSFLWVTLNLMNII